MKIDGKKVYVWCGIVIASGVAMYFTNILNAKELFFVVSYFGECIFSRHASAKIEKKDFKVSDPGVAKFL